MKKCNFILDGEYTTEDFERERKKAAEEYKSISEAIGRKYKNPRAALDKLFQFANSARKDPNFINLLKSDIATDEESLQLKDALSKLKVFNKNHFESITSQTMAVVNYLENALTVTEYLRSQFVKIIENDSINVNDKKNYIQGIKHFSDTLKEINKKLNDDLGPYMSYNDWFMKELGLISQNIERIDNIYNTSVKNIVAEWIFTSIPNENKDLSEENKRKKARLEDRLLKAQAEGNQKQVSAIQKTLAEIENEKFTLDEIKSLMAGSKDSNWLSYIFEAAGKNSDPIIAALTKKIKQQRIKARSNFYSKKVTTLQYLHDLYTSEAQGSKNNQKEFNNQLYDIVEVLEIKRTSTEQLKKDNNYEIVESYGDKLHLVKSKQQQLNRWYSPQFDNDRIRLDFEIEKESLKLHENEDADRTPFEEAKKRKIEWIKQNAQSYYKNEYYDVDSILTPSARNKLNKANEQVKEAQIHFNTLQSVSNFIALVNAEKELNSLRYERDSDNNLTDDALSIQEYYKALKDRYVEKVYSKEEIQEAEKKYQAHRDNRVRQLNAMVDAGTISPAEREVSLRRFDINAYWTTPTEEFKKAKDAIYNGIFKKDEEDKDILLKPGLRQVNDEINKRLQELGYPPQVIYDRKEFNELKGNKRDADKMYMGDTYSLEEQSKIKNIHDEIENLRNSIIMTGEQKLRLAELRSKANKTQDELNELSSLVGIYQKEKNIKKDTILKSLIEQRRLLFNELNALEEKVPTDYYTFKMNSLRDDMRAVALNKNPSLKGMDLDTEIDRLIEKEEWFLNNHYKKAVYNPNNKSWSLMYVPTDIWMNTVPTNPDHYQKHYKSRYHKNEVKEELINEKREKHMFFDEDRNRGMVPKRGSKYDKTSSAYAYSHIDKQWPPSKNVQKVIEGLTAFWAEEQRSLPEKYKSGYSLPIVRNNDLIDRFSEGNSARNLWTGIKDKFLKTEDDINQGLGLGTLKKEVKDSIDNPGFVKIYDSIPVRFTTKMPIEQVSFDIFGNLASFSYDNLLREQMNAMLGDVKMLIDTLDKQDSESMESDTSFFGKIRASFDLKHGESIRKKHIKEIVLSNMFGEYDEVMAIGNFNMTKFVSNINGLTALTTLGWKIPGAIVNFASAEVQKMIEGVAGQYITPQDIANGHALFSKYSGQFIKDGFRYREEKTPFTSMVIAWNALQGEYDGKVGDEFRKTFGKQLINERLYSMSLRQFSEAETQISLWLAFMTKHKVILRNTSTGEEENMHLFDAYMKLYHEKSPSGTEMKTLSLNNYNGNYRIFNLDFDESTGKFIKGKEFTFQDEVDKQLLIEDLNIELNGNYDKFNKPVIEKGAFGKAASLFRRFFTPMAVRRWSGGVHKRYNINKKDWDEGFYIVTYNFFRHWARNDGETLADLYNDKRVRRGLARMSMEMAFIITFFLLSKAIGDDEDEYDEYSFWHLHALYLLKKTWAETNTFNPFGGYKEITRIFDDPIVSMYQINKTVKNLELMKEWMIGEDDLTYKRDTPGLFKKGDSKLLAQALKTVGLRLDLFYPEQMLRNFNYGQRNR